MAALARSTSPTRDDLDSDLMVGEFAFAPGDVLGTRPRRRRSRWAARLLLFGLIAGGGVLHWQAPAVLPGLAIAGSNWIATMLQPPEGSVQPDLPRLALLDPRTTPLPMSASAAGGSAIGPAAEARAVVAPLASAEMPETRAREATPQPNHATAPPPAVPVVTGALPAPPSEPSATEAPPPPAYVDPLQKRAERIGLHPDLSSAILRGLSDADFRNAEAAIRTALAETAETAVYLSPKPERDTQARFKVHFVAGAETGCRRYVVTIIKRGWEATALPMERCGVRRAAGGPPQKARP